jgi:antagonist of KipI
VSGIEVLAPGPFSTVQARGREGFRHLGVGLGGALDPDTLAIANLLVGNAPTAAALEIALAGPTLRFIRPARVALCGAGFEARLDGEAFPGWHRVDVPAGSVLRIGGCRSGARAWFAIAGGLRVPDVLGSASTDLRGGFGGIEGRALRAGDFLDAEASAEAVERMRIAPWWIDPHALDPDPASPIRVLPGSDATDPANGLFAREWTVSPASDRQGLRLDGGSLVLRDPREYVSEPIIPGTVQLPPGGQPIVLLADAQTHGGYPRIGHAIRADRGRLAQLRAGDTIRFAPCTHADALAAARERAGTLARIALAIRSRGSVAPPPASA